MTPKQKLQQLAAGLHGAVLDNGLCLSSDILSGEVDVLMVNVEYREEFPIYLTVDESQILCVTYLWTESEVNPEKRAELLDTLLSMNIPMPLSSFSKIGNQYVIFGALSTHSALEEILEELYVLSENTLTAVEELADYRI
jgi:uncharacterized protein YjfI (DUF2170 family)